VAVTRPPRVDAAPWRRARRVLCVRPDGMGDVLMAGPAVRAVAAGGRHVTMLTSPAGAPAARLLPGVADVMAIRAPWVAGSTGGDDRTAIERLARGAFDAAVILTTNTQSPLPAAVWCRLAGVPLRLAHCRENPYELLTDWVPEPETGDATRHEVQRQLDLVSHVGMRAHDRGLEVRLPAGAGATARASLAGAGVEPDEPWLPIAPGASAPSRRYPAERFAEVVDLLAPAGWRPVLIGGDGDAEVLARTRRLAATPPPVVTGIDLATLGALLAMAPVLVANNSGPAHLAAAVGTPVVDLYALTNPQHAPWGVPHRLLFHDVPCRNCYRSVCPEGHQNCLRAVAPGRVVAAVGELLSRTRSGAAGVALPVGSVEPALASGGAA
jgi:ADP-heptose:LPS heptosyltransferase